MKINITKSGLDLYWYNENRITVGIVFNNEFNGLRLLLNSLRYERNYIGEVILLVNDSYSSIDINRLYNLLFEYIKLNFHIIYSGSNLGASYGKNRIIRECVSRYLLICDSDSYIRKDTISMLLNIIKKYRTYAVCPKMLYGGTNRIWFYGKYNKHFNNTIRKGEIDDIPSESISIGHMITTCVLLDVWMFKEKELWFDTEFFVYHEDISNTAFRKDVYCIFQPSTIAEHNVELLITKFDKFRHYLMFRNEIIIYLFRRLDPIGMLLSIINNIKLKGQPFKLKIRAFMYGIKLGLIKLFGLFDGKIIDINEFKYIQKLSKYRVVL